eukprot:31310-Pelagococcus_subviridis.AAC.4
MNTLLIIPHARRVLHAVWRAASSAARRALPAATGPKSTSFLLALYAIAVAASSRPSAVAASNNARSSFSVVLYARRSSRHRPSTRSTQLSTPRTSHAAMTPPSTPSRVSTSPRSDPVFAAEEASPLFPIATASLAFRIPVALASPGSINPSLTAHDASASTVSNSTTASCLFPAGTNPKYRKNGSLGQSP